MSYLEKASALPLYIIVAIILLPVIALCIIFIVMSYREGIKIGMDRKKLNKAITSSAAFTLLPSVSILLGVIALSGSLGIPASWLRLSVVGNLQYEATVAEIAAQQMGVALDSSLLTMNNLVTILMVMTLGIIWGCLLCLFTLKPYSEKLKIKSNTSSSNSNKKEGFASIAMTAMMIGLCATFVGSYIAKAFVQSNITPVVTVVVSAVFMALFEYLSKKTKASWLDSFALALSMLAGMAGACFLEVLV